MTIQTIELAGERFVILPERDFREIERKLVAAQSAHESGPKGSPFRPASPLVIHGESASEMLIRERR